jgi:betaine-aldehyde dehydrogenase
LQEASQADVDFTVQTATEGFLAWSPMTAKERSVTLFRAAALLRERNEELAAWEVQDSGKPIFEAICVDIISGAEVIEYYAELVVAAQGEQQALREDKFFYTRWEPLGVCAGIRAWNYPIQIAC